MFENRASAAVVGVIEPGYPDYAIERRVLAPVGAEVRSIRWNGERERLLQAVAALDVVLLRDVRFDAEVIGRMKPGAGLVRYGVGVDGVDLAAATARGVKVANVPDYGAEIEVSDHAAALTLALMRRVVSRHRQVLEGRWHVGQSEPIHRIGDSTLGLVGFGKIAREYLKRMRAFGIRRVLVADPHVGPELLAAHGADAVDLDTLCREAQIVSLHAPANPATRHLIDARRLALMGPRSCLVNTSRGALVDDAALARALVEGRIFGAALDVQEVEPMAADSPLRGAPNLILTDHTAWYSEASVAALQEGAARAALEILTTGHPTNWVNR